MREGKRKGGKKEGKGKEKEKRGKKKKPENEKFGGLTLKQEGFQRPNSLLPLLPHFSIQFLFLKP